MKFKITELVSRPKGTVVKLPEIRERLGTEQQYRRQLNRMLREMWQTVRLNIIPEYRNYRRVNDALVRDDDLGVNELRAQAETLIEEITAAVSTILLFESDRHTAQFIGGVNRSLGIDLTAVVRAEDLTDLIDDVARRNASLIKSLGEDTVRDIERLVVENKLNGGSVARLSEQLRESFIKSRKRALLIATDQTQKLNADLNQFRQEQTGIDEYEWSTSADERVRSLHRELDGNIYKWNESTGAEGGQKPGQPVRCRCVARAVIEF